MNPVGHDSLCDDMRQKKHFVLRILILISKSKSESKGLFFQQTKQAISKSYNQFRVK